MNVVNLGGTVDVPWDDGVCVVREAVLDAGDVDGVDFVVSERELEDAVGAEGVVEGSTVGCVHYDASERRFDGTVYACKVEDEAWRVSVMFNGWVWLAVSWEKKFGMTRTGKHML